jgi:hypothetical protein
MAEAWKVSGTYFETCNCEAVCPCVVLNKPTRGECTVLVAWHIDQGNLGATKLDGLNTVLAVHSPGHMLQVKWKVALYLDDRANPAQQEVLTKIFAGQVGGHPANLAACVGEVLGARSVPIEYREEGKKRSLAMPAVAAEAEIEAMKGADGGDVTLSNHPLCISRPDFRRLSRSRRS